jgi:hypothetical protein
VELSTFGISKLPTLAVAHCSFMRRSRGSAEAGDRVELVLAAMEHAGRCFRCSLILVYTFDKLLLVEHLSLAASRRARSMP